MKGEKKAKIESEMYFNRFNVSGCFGNKMSLSLGLFAPGHQNMQYPFCGLVCFTPMHLSRTRKSWLLVIREDKKELEKDWKFAVSDVCQLYTHLPQPGSFHVAYYMYIPLKNENKCFTIFRKSHDFLGF